MTAWSRGGSSEQVNAVSSSHAEESALMRIVVCYPCELMQNTGLVVCGSCPVQAFIRRFNGKYILLRLIHGTL